MCKSQFECHRLYCGDIYKIHVPTQLIYVWPYIFKTCYIGYIHILDVIHMCDISWYMARQTMICYGIVAICLSTCDRWPHRRLETFIIYLFIVYLSDGHWASSSNKMCDCYHQMGTIIYAGRGSKIHGKNISCFCKFLNPTPMHTSFNMTLKSGQIA